jgi:hypothetical protein
MDMAEGAAVAIASFRLLIFPVDVFGNSP